MSNQTHSGYPKVFEYHAGYSTLEIIAVHILAILTGLIFTLMGGLREHQPFPMRAHFHFLVVYWIFVALGLRLLTENWTFTFGKIGVFFGKKELRD